MISQILVRRYAQGLVNSVVSEEEFSNIQRELTDFSEFLSRYENLKKILLSPFHTRSKRIQIIKQVLGRKGYQKKTVRFLVLLIDNDRLHLLEQILDLLPELWNERQGITTFEVTSAVPLNESQKRRLKEGLESLEKRKVFLKYKIDEKLIAGISVKKGNIVYDVSLRRGLEKLKEKISEG